MRRGRDKIRGEGEGRGEERRGEGGKRGTRGRRGEDREKTEGKGRNRKGDTNQKEYHELGVKIFLLVRTTMKINHTKTFDSRTMAQASGMVVR